MRIMVERCCALDVHQEAVVACLLIGAPGVRPTKEVRTFRTMTRELEALRDWLTAARVTHVGMESTGVSVKSVELPCRHDWRPTPITRCGCRRLKSGARRPAPATQYDARTGVVLGSTYCSEVNATMPFLASGGSV